MPLSDAEITRLLAEKIMGWATASLSDSVVTRWLTPEQGCGFRTSDYGYAHTFDPLHSIEHAWEVRGRLAEWGHIEVSFHPVVTPHDRAHFVAYSHAPTNVRGSYGAADSAPRAICYAALRAVGVEPEG